MPDLSLERSLTGIVVGVDEVGRGPLAGPVVAAAVIIDPATLPAELAERLDDSKKLSAAKRQHLDQLVRAHCHFAIAEASVAEIDRLNILKATFLAMQRAVAGLGRAIDHALVDGNRPPPLPCPVTCVVGGDGKSLSIAAASVVAKEYRDRLMRDLDVQFPGYGWAKNAGYGTKAHLEALRRLGPTPHHRISFAPVAQFELM
ncbi:ribonuclease HII [Magnetospirillum sp. 64-120]|mgnify:CR=1 FL=1|uniref:ribonuclease HII n=1 Tax=Magnetospirillum sp. 64-120 TaxID=1895778 RepID=UPI00092BA037|nr:ribonuclease HII [Magnetospirillum sp. 64-120]OJX70384.1 MAG: ribonuclease HII [Magnetospirillum sp. 64-120]